jgi:hypothetical protein
MGSAKPSPWTEIFGNKNHGLDCSDFAMDAHGLPWAEDVKKVGKNPILINFL